MLVSYKLHFARRRIRIVLARDEAGVDILGVAATPIFVAAAPLIDWLLARDADAVIRALYIHPALPRAIVSLDPPRAHATKPWVLRLEGADAAAFLGEAPDLPATLRAAAKETLERRATRA